MLCHSIVLYLPFLSEPLAIIHPYRLSLLLNFDLHFVIVLVPLLDFKKLPHVAIWRRVEISKITFQQITINRVRERKIHVDRRRCSLLSWHRGVTQLISC